MRRNERGNSILEFAIVMSVLIPMFAGMVTLSMALSRDIEVSSVCRDAVVLLVRSVTDPQSGLDLSQTQNQRIIVAAANGLNMASDAQDDPSSTGGGVVILSQVILVGPQQCDVGVVPNPSGVPNTTGPNYGWTSSNCPNYGQYVFAYRVVIGNGTRWTSTLGSPPTADVGTNGTISAANIAKDTSNRATNMGSGGVMTLTAGNYALISEMYADVSFLNLFSIWHAPVLYARSIS
ncbi:MAG TPA: TadE/TadG family type IV pilus assembly protein [Bryobacteraceae bacterium]|nr:TadE/TadG family type IV pilus assembly protein [Bryobacteraceae bacterium]